MKKRGQFYFIAALIIIVILSGLSVIYTSIKTQNENIDIKESARDARYETNQLIDNRMLAGVNDNQIAITLKDIPLYYSNKYNGLNIIIVYGDETLAYIINSTMVTQAVPISENGKKIVKLQLPSEYKFEMKPNYKSLYIIALREKDGERAIAIE